MQALPQHSSIQQSISSKQSNFSQSHRNWFQGGIIAVPLTFAALYFWRRPSKHQASMMLFSNNEEGEPEPQKQKNSNQRRWEDPQSHLLNLAPEQPGFRIPLLEALRNFRIGRFGPAAQLEDAELAGQSQSQIEQKEYLVVAPPAGSWDPSCVSDPIFAAQKVSAEELEDERLMALLMQKRDEELNILTWKCLGYKYVAIGAGYAWDTAGVFPKWRSKYPIPPDLAGLNGYTPETIEAVEFLVRLTAQEYHDALERHAKSRGLRYSPKHVSPTATRKVEVTQWLMYYRDKYFGMPTEELLRRKQLAAQDTKKTWMKQMQQRADALGIPLADVLEQEERKKKRQRFKKKLQQRESNPLVRSPTLP